ncbi:MAG: S8 family serine peptidase [Sphingobacteriaceae bacterium]|nr:S8 family serine peptidase [Sphingobacteriaceae bacterium]
MNKLLLISGISFLLTFAGGVSNAQTKYWVKFKNKNGTPYTLNNPTAYLSGQSYLRRITYAISLDSTDLPVTPAYVSQLSAVPNVTLVYVSKWINGAVVAITNTNVLSTINSFSFVNSTAPVSKYKLNNITVPDEPQSYIGKGTEAVSTPSPFYGGAWWQAKQLGVECLHSQGYRGQGITIAVLDAGFKNVDINPVFDSLRNRNGILGTRDFVTGGNSVYEDDNHGAMVLSCMAAIKPGTICGTAPMANYWLLRTEDAPTEKIVEEYNWIRGAEFADSVGADILTTSLGYTTFDIPSQNHSFADLDGKTAHMSIASTMAARKGMFVLNSAGNGNGGPWPKIGIPADADSICSVGAIDSLSNVAGFSSLGPTADGRIKPDLVARGSKAWVSFVNGSCGYSNGTSFACPILAGAVACFWQAHKTYNCIKVLDTLRNTATFSLTPNNSRGWGRPQMCLIPPIVTNADELKTKSDFRIFPNPFSSEITIDLLAEGAKKISITNLIGQTIQELTINEKTKRLDLNLNNFSPGVYFIKVQSGNYHTIKKVIKN